MISQPYPGAGQADDYIDSYYARTLDCDTHYPSLQENITAPVCIVGGGMAGMAVAHGLTDRGVKPVLLEGRRIGFGASGRNGGQLGSGRGAKRVPGQHR